MSKEPASPDTDICPNYAKLPSGSSLGNIYRFIYLGWRIRNCTDGCSDKNGGSSTSEGSIAGIAMYMSSVENGMLQQRLIFERLSNR